LVSRKRRTQQPDDVAINLGMVGRATCSNAARLMKLNSESRAAVDRGRARLRVDHRKLADQCAGAEDRQNTLAPPRATPR
jgi:hypothetical protein